ERITADDVTERVTADDVTETVTAADVIEIVTVDNITEIVSADDVTEAVTIDNITEIVTYDDVTEIVTTDDVTELVTTDDVTETITTDDVTETITTDDVTYGVTADGVTEIIKDEDVTETITPDNVTDTRITDGVADTVTKDSAHSVTTVLSSEGESDEITSIDGDTYTFEPTTSFPLSDQNITDPTSGATVEDSFEYTTGDFEETKHNFLTDKTTDDEKTITTEVYDYITQTEEYSKAGITTESVTTYFPTEVSLSYLQNYAMCASNTNDNINAFSN
ncbi:unnamed protein product, partial [Owenia fusiformis]